MSEPMTWRPVPQGPCPCCGTDPKRPTDEGGFGSTRRGAPKPVPHPAGGVTYPVDPGDPLGERLQTIYALRQWIADTDPDPAEYPGDRLHYGRHIA